MESDKEAPTQAELQARYDSILEEASQVFAEIEDIQSEIAEYHRIFPDLKEHLEDIRYECHERSKSFDPDNPVCPDGFFVEDTGEWIDSNFELDDEEKEANTRIRALEKQLFKPRSELKKLQKQIQGVILQAKGNDLPLKMDSQKEVLLGFPSPPIPKTPNVKQDSELSSSTSDEINPLDFGGKDKGKELCVVWSYFLSGEHNLARLARMLKNKVKIRYPIRGTRGKTRDPYEWYSSNPKGFKSHLYKVRKNAKEHPKVALIPKDYWKSYR